MLRFENELFLIALAILPLFIVIYILFQYFTQKKIKAYTDKALVSKLIPTQSRSLPHIKFSMLMLVLALLLVALANPQVGTSLEKGKRKGVDIMVCMDVSNSMLAKDYAPNRIEAAKMAMSHFVDELQGDRVGLIVFAGKAFVQLPITSDYAAAKMFINSISTDMIAQQGTDITAAIDLGIVSMLPELKNTSLDANKISQLQAKVMVIVSDGEDHFEEAVEMATEANKLGIIIHTMGIGSKRGEPIPYRNDFMKDDEGNTVITKLNDQMLKDIAAAGGGVFVHAPNANAGFDLIFEKIDAMHKVDLQEITFTKYESRYYWPLSIALILLVIESLLFVTQPKWKKVMRNIRKSLTIRKIGLFLFMMAGATVLQAQNIEEIAAMRKGNAEYEKAEQLRKEALQLLASEKQSSKSVANSKMNEASKHYQAAETCYRKATAQTKDYAEANYNLANALYRQKKYEDAIPLYQELGKSQELDKSLRAQAYHNAGNSLLKGDKYGESINEYKNALKLDPKSQDTKYNLEYAKKKLQQQQQQQQQQNQDNQDQNKDQQNKDQNKDQENKDQNKDQQQQDQNKDQQNKDQDQQDQNKDQQQQQQDQQKQDQQKQQQEQQKAQQQKKDDERQLDALQQNERQTQRKVQEKKMGKPVKGKQQKQW